MREQVGDDAGLVVPRQDECALAEALLRMLDDVPFRTHCGEAALARIERHFSVDRMIDDYASLLGLCSPSARGR
jgi:glycosyltransferase involved in cell wall biosynthesis